MGAKPASDERIMAALAHLSAMAFGLGMVVPAVFWAEQRKKSRYLAFQSLQAYGYQSLGYTLWMLAYLASLILMILPIFAVNLLTELGPGAVTTFLAVWMLAFFFVVLGMFGLFFILPLVGTGACFLGLDFRYPLLGSRLAKYIGYDAANPQHETDSAREEQFAASMGHFAVIFPLFGLLAPLVLWLMKGKESVYLRIQSAQTVLYQAFGSLVYLVLYVLAVSLLMPLYASLIFSGTIESINMAAISLFFIGMCLLGQMTLLAPLYHILGQWAGLRILQGHDYRYPLLGRAVEKRLSSPGTLSGQ